ncbi:hypothetical protein LOK49_LG08G01448 [Camellia lanceoleosa]|uniref:Uncharacterized protein n=1 Tax=Camellia lanceoleosa TaxID=1840588 RepID=A0ACC0GQT2_9ERIC|nr:hypothetical protein LOK49_LG08G01448 [Camellia lanceoleosa]
MRASFSITPWNDNLFLFTFEDAEDRGWVLQEAPWSIIGNLMIIQPLQKGTPVADLEFLWSPFWVQVHGLLPEKLTKANGEFIGKRIGRLIRVEAHCEGISSNPWVSFKFEKLSDFCFDCGRIGHDKKACKFVTREEGMGSGYGSDLPTGIARSTGLLVEYYKQQVDEMDIRLRPLLNRFREQLAGMSAPRAPTMARGLQRGEIEVGQSNAGRVRGTPVQLTEHVPGTNVEIVEKWGRKKDNTEVLKNSNISDAQGSAMQDKKPKAHYPMGNDTQIPSGPDLKEPLPKEAGNSLRKPKAPSGPKYFVTEPSELPLCPAHKTAMIKTSSSPIGIAKISPSSSPTHTNLKTIVIDDCMATVFNSLTLKRKAHEENECLGRLPKLLKGSEVSTEAFTTGALSVSHSSLSIRAQNSSLVRGRGNRRTGKAKKGLQGDLYEVKVVTKESSLPSRLAAYSSTEVDKCCSQVPSTYPLANAGDRLQGPPLPIRHLCSASITSNTS